MAREEGQAQGRCRVLDSLPTGWKSLQDEAGGEGLDESSSIRAEGQTRGQVERSPLLRGSGGLKRRRQGLGSKALVTGGAGLAGKAHPLVLRTMVSKVRAGL